MADEAQITTPAAPAGAEAQAPAPAPAAPAATQQPASGDQLAQDPAEPAAPDYADAVMKRRDAASLAKLMKEKRELDARAETYKGAEPALAAVTRAQKLWESGDHAGAFHEFMSVAAGDAAKVKEHLPKLYDQLTSQILGVDSPQNVAARTEREIATLKRELEELKQERATTQAEYEQWTSQDRERRVSAAVESVGALLEKTSDYPFLMAEADNPAQVVWDIMVEAIERGEEPPEPEAAAKLANQYFQPIFEKKKNRYQNLLAPQGASGSNQPETPSSQNGSRKSLTNADAATAPDLQTPQPITDRDESIDAAWRLLQERHRQT
jgi:hypothetical protein